MSPPFIFRIDEIGEDPNAPVIVENPMVYQLADWKPSLGTIRAIAGGVGGRWWHCDGRQIREIAHSQFPGNAVPFQTFSVFYGNGFGFWVYRGDATRPNAESTFQPLRFEHDRDDGYSSYLSDAADERALLCRREDQAWLRMLLPDIYHGHTVTPYPQYGALKGDLGILLGLIAFTMKPEQLQNYLPQMFQHGTWNVHGLEHGRTHQRGVVVYIYTNPANYPSRGSHGSNANDLRNYERGVYGKYYN